MPEKAIAYYRMIKTRPVTFVCECHPGGPVEITEERYPGPLPKYCLDCRNSGVYDAYRSQRELDRYHKSRGRDDHA